jgi:predicted DNA binding CopG/RHH family protein
MDESERSMTTLPVFPSEQAEAEFWDTHDSIDFLDTTEPVEMTFIDARLPKKQISLRLEQSAIEQLKILATRKGIGYQTLIRMWLIERLRQEVL